MASFVGATAILLLAGQARAAAPGPSAATQHEADEHERRGIDAVKRADAETARQEFSQSYALVPAPKTLWNLLVAEADSNHPLDALKHLKAYLADPNGDPKRKEQGKKLLAELSAQAGHLRIVVAEGVPVTLDGNPVSSDDLKSPLDIPAGRHSVDALFRTGTQRQSVDVPAGTETSISFEAANATLPPAAASVGPPPKEEPAWRVEGSTANRTDSGKDVSRASGSHSQRTLGFIVGGAGLVALGAGAYFGLRALSLKHDSDDEANSARDMFLHRSGDFQGQAQKSKDDYDSASRSQTIGLIAAGVGAAALGVGIYLVLSAKDPHASSAAAETRASGKAILLVPNGTGASAIVRF